MGCVCVWRSHTAPPRCELKSFPAPTPCVGGQRKTKTDGMESEIFISSGQTFRNGSDRPGC